MTATVGVRRAARRSATTTYWLDSRHSFSFGDHYDPDNTHHGLLIVNNESTLQPGNGFAVHPHEDVEILTWVLSGQITHRDSIGNAEGVYPGLAQCMSAGKGILHSELNDSSTEPVQLVQMWIMPDEHGGEPSYQQREVDHDLRGGGLVTIASGMPGSAAPISVRNRNVALHCARLSPGESVTVPAAPYLHLFVARGQVTAEGAGELYENDAVRFTDSDGPRVTAVEPSEILVWEMHAELGGPR